MLIAYLADYAIFQHCVCVTCSVLAAALTRGRKSTYCRCTNTSCTIQLVLPPVSVVSLQSCLQNSFVELWGVNSYGNSTLQTFVTEHNEMKPVTCQLKFNKGLIPSLQISMSVGCTEVRCAPSRRCVRTPWGRTAATASQASVGQRTETTAKVFADASLLSRQWGAVAEWSRGGRSTRGAFESRPIRDVRLCSWAKHFTTD